MLSTDHKHGILERNSVTLDRNSDQGIYKEALLT